MYVYFRHRGLFNFVQNGRKGNLFILDFSRFDLTD